ncbi:hypothetical protein OG735_04545 [Streptomyces sp. NBC_01210]|uniref:hypothetical protein n=1 Tax=Streptomyces sp. NBC_01210 TaxID=2903774 RepID=UPI002E1149E5|nr:hypothetical protein OG735_04545 [Streptomyces sp. NBC_01210]
MTSSSGLSSGKYGGRKRSRPAGHHHPRHHHGHGRYDAFGRRTTGLDGSSVGYYTGDLVRQITKGDTRQTYGLDVANRQATVTAEIT